MKAEESSTSGMSSINLSSNDDPWTNEERQIIIVFFFVYVSKQPHAWDVRQQVRSNPAGSNVAGQVWHGTRTGDEPKDARQRQQRNKLTLEDVRSCVV